MESLILWSAILALFGSQVAKVLSASGSGVSLCSGQSSCGDCISTDARCAWCSQPTEQGSDRWRTRCDLVENLRETGCGPEFIVRPKNVLDQLQVRPLSSESGSGAAATQLSPQKLKLTLTLNSPQTVEVEFRQAKDYPLDLYVLMDLSASMEKDKEKLASLGDSLAERMKTITSNFRLGFGSFVDKTVLPFTDTDPKKLERPCKLKQSEEYCAKPYSYKHDLSLTDNVTKFKESVLAAPVSGNLDGPEGGLDAIMQAVVCQEQIGWRSAARHLILFATDAEFHMAGDAKLGGIVTPADGHCHLDSNGFFDKSNEQDYPSVGELLEVVANHSVNIIFAVGGATLPVYRKLSHVIAGSAAAELADDSSNIVSLIRDNYQQISSSVSLTDDSPENVLVTYKSSCLSMGTDPMDTDVCSGLKVGSTVKFLVEITAKSCPASPAFRNLHIKPTHLAAEQLEIQLHVTCGCDCEMPKNQEPNSVRCSGGKGTYQCGICDCHSERFGRFCECDASNPNLQQTDQACFPANTTTSGLQLQQVCSGRGVCVCGQCSCFPRTDPAERNYGDLCQCTNYDCPKVGGKICAGRGVCECGECVCESGWDGDDCSCTTSKATCVSPNGLLCNTHGECVCGACACDVTSGYHGLTCDDCPTCPGPCDRHKSCVQCRVFATGKYDEDLCSANCFPNNTHLRVVDDIHDEIEESGWDVCSALDEDNCRFYFAHYYDNNDSAIIMVQQSKDCPAVASGLVIGLSIFGAVLLVLLFLLLLWFFVREMHYRMEVAKFQRELGTGKWSEMSPLHKPAITKYKNPMYKGGTDEQTKEHQS